ncbi:UNC-like C-terminal-domain-containing protein [Daedaleopsis nitida]|nr:UNC-like C-terminal-domain-containing protein [Daedaleopsis nitida]
MLSLLPTSLLALLFSSPALSTPTTPNDPLRAIAVHAPKQPEEPVCCLRPLTPLEPVAEEDMFPSFEDWKARRLSELNERALAQDKAAENLSESTLPANTSQSLSHAQGTISVDMQGNGGAQERLPPHFQIPITDRFNYASLDCSARVHGSHKSAKSTFAILSSKKDRYMLSPCAEKQQFVVVELCEDIRIDTVQLANYEFFSGVFKDFTVSVAKTYTGEWTPAGTFRGRNVRGVQSFHPPPTLRDFYRYIRIDFHSHYGNEYYCPVSLLRVYGLTHLEEWQWDTWEAESRAKRSVEEANSPVDLVAEPPEPARSPDSTDVEDGSIASIPLNTGLPGAATISMPITSDILKSLNYDISSRSVSLDTSRTSNPVHDHGEAVASPTKTHTPNDESPQASVPHDTLYNTHVSLSTASSHAHSPASDSHSPASSSSSVSIDSHHQHSDSVSGSHSHSHSSSPSLRASSATPNVSSLSTISPAYSAPPISTGGESIYRTIMNRLTALEHNTTLYTRYVEEQTAGMRDILRRLTEDLGRLDGIGKAQAQLYQRSVVELEKQTQRLEDEQRVLISRVNLLTDEVVLEKRLGIAQLCLLLTVLVFMALTRGSRGDYAAPPGAQASVRDWGRRTLSFSGELVNRLRTRSSTPPRAGGEKPGGSEIAFPSTEGQTSDEHPRARRTTGGGHTRRTNVRPHTPTSNRTPTNRHFVHHRAGVPASPSHHHVLMPRPMIQRSSSGGISLGGIGPVPKSAKRWARSAHLHEVKLGSAAASASPRRRSSDGQTTPVPVAGPSSSSTGTPPLAERDVFDDPDDGDDGAQVLLLPLPEAIGRSDTVETLTLGKGKGRMVDSARPRQPSPLRPAATIDLSSPPARGRSLFPSESPGDASEGDAWVDTDVDGSECDSVVDVRERERTYPVTATNSSL